MIEISGTYKEIRMVLPATTVGTANYVARIFDVTGEIIHNIKAINGITLQWVTGSISLLTIVDDAIAKIAELHPPSEFPDLELPQPVEW